MISCSLWDRIMGEVCEEYFGTLEQTYELHAGFFWLLDIETGGYGGSKQDPSNPLRGRSFKCV